MQLLYDLEGRDRLARELEVGQRLNLDHDDTFVRAEEALSAVFDVQLCKIMPHLHHSVVIFST